MKFSHWMCPILQNCTGDRVFYITDIPKNVMRINFIILPSHTDLLSHIDFASSLVLALWQKKLKKFLVKLNFLSRYLHQVMGKRFSCFQSAQSSFVVFPASCVWYGGLYLEMRQSECEASYTPSSIAEIKNAWSCTSTSPVCLHGMILK